MNKLEKNLHSLLPLNRKEKFFTATILPQLICHENFKHFHRFTNLIDGFPRNLRIKPDVDENNILFFTEYSLKESLTPNSSTRKFTIPKTKDTPDLVILITEPELLLIVIEAKVFSSSDAYSLTKQMKNQKNIIESISSALNIREKNIFHLGLTPANLIDRRLFTEFQLLYWEDILEAYRDILNKNYFFGALENALKNFDRLSSKNTSTGFGSFRKNMETMLSGSEIVSLYKHGHNFWVGRKQGLHGTTLLNDKKTGNWKIQKYEINLSSKEPPNKNWFSAKEFVEFMENEIKENATLNSSPKRNTEIKERVSTNLTDAWHFSHLGKEYFLQVARIAGFGETLDAPINLIYIGKKGVPYIEKKYGRKVNPNWAIVTKDGRELKFMQNGKKLDEGLWNRSHCHVFAWEEIKNFFRNEAKIK